MALYDEIGGRATIRAALRTFYPRVLADPVLSPFFLGVDIERLKQVQEDYLAVALGAPGPYVGRSLRDAHARARRRGADAAVFDHFVTVFKGVLLDLGVPDAKVGEVTTVFENARDQVLTDKRSRPCRS